MRLQVAAFDARHESGAEVACLSLKTLHSMCETATRWLASGPARSQHDCHDHHLRAADQSGEGRALLLHCEPECASLLPFLAACLQLFRGDAAGQTEHQVSFAATLQAGDAGGRTQERVDGGRSEAWTGLSV